MELVLHKVITQPMHPPIHRVTLPLPAAKLSSQAQQVFVSSMEVAHRLETDTYLMQSMGQLIMKGLFNLLVGVSITETYSHLLRAQHTELN